MGQNREGGKECKWASRKWKKPGPSIPESVSPRPHALPGSQGAVLSRPTLGISQGHSISVAGEMKPKLITPVARVPQSPLPPHLLVYLCFYLLCAEFSPAACLSIFPFVDFVLSVVTFFLLFSIPSPFLQLLEFCPFFKDCLASPRNSPNP